MESRAHTLLSICFSGALILGSETLPAANTAVLKAKCVTKIEQLAQSVFPQEKVERAKGFFGPVTKKYSPIFDHFYREYRTASNKIVIVKKYLPQADAALKEAKAMKIPAKYEAEKAEYIRTAEGFLMMTKLTVRLGE